MDGAGSITLIVIVVLVVVFLILREFNCWYWKINERISLLKEQNSVLESILNELKNEPKSKHKTTSPKKGDNYSSDKTLNEDEKEEDTEQNERNYEIELTTAEQKQVDAFVKFGFTPGQRLVINKITRKIYKFEDKEWIKVDQSEWIILIEN